MARGDWGFRFFDCPDKSLKSLALGVSPLSVFAQADRKLAESIVEMSHLNPFAPERMEVERLILGDGWSEEDAVWNWRNDRLGKRKNFGRIKLLCENLMGRLKPLYFAAENLPDDDRHSYEQFLLVILYHRYGDELEYAVENATQGRGMATRVPFYQDLFRDAQSFIRDDESSKKLLDRLPGLVALTFQLRRGFYFILRSFIGGSEAAAKLRMSVWESCFTHDTKRYSRGLFEKMGDIPTLVCGPSGTGKELVARCIGMSRYIPFDPVRECFVKDFSQDFYPICLSALASSVIESELFGHVKGAYTGATGDRLGFFEVAGPFGTVFLDEIGEVNEDIQVKLLRVLQSRNFQRIGDTKLRCFDGKIIAATNADLVVLMKEGKFREDLYYRLCADKIETPSLQVQIQDDSNELKQLTLHIANRVVGEEMAPSLAEDVWVWMNESLPEDYSWPGNIRELEQCVRNILIRNDYQPARSTHGKPKGGVYTALENRSLKLNELIQWYCTTVYSESDGYEDAARKLGVDPRTLKAKVDPALLEELKNRE